MATVRRLANVLIFAFLAIACVWVIALVAAPWVEIAIRREAVVFRLLEPQASQAFFVLTGGAVVLICAAIIWRPAGRWLARLSESGSAVMRGLFIAILAVGAVVWAALWVTDKALPHLDTGTALSKPAYLAWTAQRILGEPVPVPGAEPVCTSAARDGVTTRLCQPRRAYPSGAYLLCDSERPDELRLATTPEGCDEAQYFIEWIGL